MHKIRLSELLRKSIHISSILIPLAFRYVFKNSSKHSFLVLIPLSLVLILIDTMRIEHRTFKKFYQNLFGIILRKHELSDFTGAVYVLVSAVVCIAVFPPDIAFMSLSFLAIGDTLAALVGISFGKRKLKGGKKSLEGSLACFTGTFLFGFFYKLSIPDFGISMSIITLGALAATLAEAGRIPCDDNIKIPLFSGIVMYLGNQFFV